MPGKLSPFVSPCALYLSLNLNHRPGLRERLVLSEKYVLTDAFWQTFAQSFRFHWPYGLGEAFDIDKRSGYIQFSGTFHNHLQEIRHWRMDVGFLEMFPEFYDDITPVERICPQLELSCRPSFWDTELWIDEGETGGRFVHDAREEESNWRINYDIAV